MGEEREYDSKLFSGFCLRQVEEGVGLIYGLLNIGYGLRMVG